MSTTDELPEARARLFAAADAELRRIERALHDGVQQSLIAVSVRLQLARQLSGTDIRAATALLGEVERDVRAALDDVRSLANGIYPSVLDARGLPDALRGAVSATGVAATVDAAGVGRYPTQVETAVYFFCRAALEALAGHPGAEARVSVRVREDERTLRLDVDSDTGRLDAPSDLLGVPRDRIEALGGAVSFEAAAGVVRLKATVPLF